MNCTHVYIEGPLPREPETELTRPHNIPGLAQVISAKCFLRESERWLPAITDQCAVYVNVRNVVVFNKVDLSEFAEMIITLEYTVRELNDVETRVLDIVGSRGDIYGRQV